MRIDIYRDDTLAATFEYGQRPSYYGEPGRRVRELVARPHCVRNLWTGEATYAPPAERPDWWAADILSAGLREAGFEPRVSMPVVLPAPPPPPSRALRRVGRPAYGR